MKAKHIIYYVCFFYLVIGFFLIFHYQYHSNPDGIAYIGIAKKYSLFDFSGAVNTYWSPLLSWLLVPILAMGVEGILAARVVFLLSGLLLIILIERFLSLFKVSNYLKLAFLVALIPVIFEFAFILVTPDLLLTSILLAYFLIIFEKDYLERPQSPFLCGALGAAAYLTKSYAFVFFLAHFLIFNLILKWRSGKSTLRSLVIGYITFLVVSLPWVVLISQKQGFLTLGTSALYNHALVGPAGRGYTINSNVIIPPTTKSATSVWEDPSYILNYLAIDDWNPLASAQNLRYQVFLAAKNLLVVAFLFFQFCFFSPAILYLAILKVKGDFSRISKNPYIFYTLVTIFLYPVGYLAILVEPRYLWPVFILTLILGLVIADFYLRRKTSRLAVGVFVALFIISFTAWPIYNLKLRFNLGKDLYEDATSLSSSYCITGANIASNWEGTAATLYAYHLEARFFGQTGNVSQGDLMAILDKYDIDYYFAWDNYKPLDSRNFKIIESKVPRLSIWEIQGRCLVSEI